MTHDSTPKCSFCKQEANKKNLVIVTKNQNIAICSQCIKTCGNLLNKKSNKSSVTKKLHLSPSELFKKLNEYVIGQEEAKKILSVAIYNHYKKIKAAKNKNNILEKSNILMVGPTGSGKTLLVKTLAKILSIPIVVTDATALTETGYVGEDVENILLKLLQESNFKVNEAEKGIIYIDEIDKISRRKSPNLVARDISGEGVQQALLKMTEGSVIDIPIRGARKEMLEKSNLRINTNNILFICGGSFIGLKESIQKKFSKKSIGFINVAETKVKPRIDIQPEDLISYGLIPEFVGRFPIITHLTPIDKGNMMQILTEPKNSLIKQYELLFAMDNIKLIFTEDALEEIAEQTIKRNLGARGLRGIIEKTLLQTMFDTPENNLKEVIVDRAAVQNNSELKIVTTKEKKLEKKTCLN